MGEYENYQRELGEELPYCDICMEFVEAVTTCSDCGNTFCNDCYPDHRDGDSHMDHAEEGTD